MKTDGKKKISYMDEQPRYKDMEIPEEAGKQKRLLRSLFNVRMPGKISEDDGKES